MARTSKATTDHDAQARRYCASGIGSLAPVTDIARALGTNRDVINGVVRALGLEPYAVLKGRRVYDRDAQLWIIQRVYEASRDKELRAKAEAVSEAVCYDAQLEYAIRWVRLAYRQRVQMLLEASDETIWKVVREDSQKLRTRLSLLNDDDFDRLTEGKKYQEDARRHIEHAEKQMAELQAKIETNKREMEQIRGTRGSPPKYSGKNRISEFTASLDLLNEDNDRDAV